ncbi:MAG: type II toxin-antitoxin system HipA family toxin [Acidimicrobiia bacterium]
MTPTEPSLLRSIDAGDVYKRGRRAARLVREPTAIRFEYLAAYLEDPAAPAVATTLPRSQVPVRTGGAGAVHPFFAGLLPEGRRLGALQRAVKTSADDELTLLLAVGADTIGDVQVVPLDAPLPADPTAVEIDDWHSVRFADIYADVTGERLEPRRASIAGVQVKVSARVISLPVARAHERMILKLDQPEYPHLVANEAFFLEAARKSGLPAAAAELVHDHDGHDGLVVTRFDRVGERDDKPRQLAQEDACQVLGRYPADKYRLTTEAVVAGLAGVTSAPVVAARDILRQFAFAFLTCNGDAHAKNFSVLRAGGEWRVSPAYDLPSSYPYGDATLALSIDGKLDERIGRRDFVRLGRAVGVPERAVSRVLDDLVDRVDTWVDDLAMLPFDERTLHKLRRAIEYRRQRLAIAAG